ncbi:patatin-like phospholipase family protein [Tersicoccus sp. Bi-70]|uniref:patatin-like phospholipase family protein n=1 Tax=Tersicoccus sp. Bi-70 TaxID=1897634 RepID=UPI00097708D3|nr:patatin [Tersicoccus sp. Bi-70]OMH33117.1 patatin [Tersicoccus sp. Bi-70]
MTEPGIDATGRVPRGQRALVLHGGGSAGNAWEIGVIAGLADAGLDVLDADLIIGTSAGATAAAQVTGSPVAGAERAGSTPAELLAAILEAAPGRSGRPAGPAGAAGNAGSPGNASSAGGRGAAGAVADHLERTNRIIAAATDAADMRRRMGAAALELDATSDGAAATRWRETVAARLPGLHWPERALLITAVDARTGEPVVFDRHSGVDLVDAVAASTSSGAPYRIGADRYIDGGYRRNENADLAAGYARVLVLSPFGGRSRHPSAWGMQLAAQVAELRGDGSAVETILPDEGARDAFGTGGMMDPASRPPAARAGHRQGRALAGPLAAFWH